MADIKTPEECSLNMSKICSKDTKPEIWLQKKLFERGYCYRKNVNNVPGHLDLWLAKYDTVVFVHGCFWHRHEDCKYAYMLKSGGEFWTKKFRKNMERDVVARNELAEVGVKILIVWECTAKQMMKSEDTMTSVLDKIEAFLNGDDQYMEL